MRKLLSLIMALGLATGSFAIVGCERDAGDHFEEAVEETREGVEEAADEARDNVRDAGNDLGDFEN
jgi:predicted Kef-type K+ transport protein